MKKILVVFLIGIFSVFLANVSIYAAANTTANAKGCTVSNWTGFYVGLNSGYGLGGSHTVHIIPDSANFTPVIEADGVATSRLAPDGFIGGGQVGYNQQLGNVWVVGLETDMQYANLRDSATAYADGKGEFVQGVTNLSQRLLWLNTTRVRVGMLPMKRLLIYATGGLAVGETAMRARISFPTTRAPQEYVGKSDVTRIGWTMGAGAEWALCKNWSVKGEYLWYDLGNGHVNILEEAGGVEATARAAFDTKGNILRLGLNYRF